MRRMRAASVKAAVSVTLLAAIAGCSSGSSGLNSPAGVTLGEHAGLFAPMPPGYHGCPDDTYSGNAYAAAFKGASSVKCSGALPAQATLLVIADGAEGGRTGRAGQTWRTAADCTAGRYSGPAQPIDVPKDVRTYLATIGGADVAAAVSSYTFKGQLQYVALVCFGSIDSGYLDLDALATTRQHVIAALPDLWSVAKHLKIGSYLRTSAPGFPAQSAGAPSSASPSGTSLAAPASTAPTPTNPGAQFGATQPVAIPFVSGQPATFQDVQTLMHDVDLAITDLNAEDFWYAGVDPSSQFAQNVIHNQFTYFQQAQQTNRYAKFYEHVFSEKDVQFDSGNPNIVRILVAEGTSAVFTMGGDPGYYVYTLTLGPSQASFPGGSTAEVLGIQNVDVAPSTNDAWYNGWPK